MTCVFSDNLGAKKEISNIVFTNFDVSKTKTTTYQGDAGVITNVKFGLGTVCDIIGPNQVGITVNCRDIKDRDGNQGNRNGGGWG